MRLTVPGVSTLSGSTTELWYQDVLLQFYGRNNVKCYEALKSIQEQNNGENDVLS